MKNKKILFIIIPSIIFVTTLVIFLATTNTFKTMAKNINASQDPEFVENEYPTKITLAVNEGNSSLPEVADLPQSERVSNIIVAVNQEVGGKYVVVSKSQGTVTAYDSGQVVYVFPVGHGRGLTPEGNFRIFAKYTMRHMAGAGYAVNSPYSMKFYGSYYLHGADGWNPNLHDTSHGCVNMHDADAQTLFAWAPIGTPVTVVS